MAENKSIFEFADKFGYESPFGDWLKEDFSKKNSLAIKFVSCCYLNKNYQITFNVISEGLIGKNATIIIAETDTWIDDAAAETICKITYNSQNVLVSFSGDSDFTEFWFDDGNIFKGIVVCDSLYAISKTFILCPKTTENIQNKEENNNTVIPETNLCGAKYKGLIKCTRYKGQYGPIYKGKHPLASFKGFDKLISNNVITVDDKDILVAVTSITKDEKDIILAMSENEGNLDAVQAYDSEIVTAGAMQKTLNPEGYGELPEQVWGFKLKYPLKYQTLLGNCKWRVEEEEIKNAKGKIIRVTYRMYYDNITGKALKDKIRTGFTKDNYNKTVESLPLLPIIELLNDIDFQGKQVEDFVKRLHQALAKKPTNYANLISDFVDSKLGRALVLDHDVNRPNHVSMYFDEALNRFYKANPNVSKNPKLWGANHAVYESKLLEIYGPLRGEKLGKVKSPMTDAKNRFTKLKNKL